MKRRLLLVPVAAVVVLGVAVSWTLAGLPPVRMVLRYGLSHGPSPTGRTKVLEGITFVEIGPGCFRMGSVKLSERSSLQGRLPSEAEWEAACRSGSRGE